MKIFDNKPTLDEYKLIEDMNSKGMTLGEAYKALYRHRENKRITTTIDRCMKDVDVILFGKGA